MPGPAQSDTGSPALVACLNGSVLGRVLSPGLPFSEAELAAEARRCADAGATYVVCTPRDADGRPLRDPAALLDAFAAIRASAGIPVASSLLDFDADLETRQVTLQARTQLVEIPIGAPRMVRFDAATASFAPDRVLALPRSEVSSLALDAQERGIWPIALVTDLLDLAAISSLFELELLSPALPLALELDAADADALLALRHRLTGRRWALGARGPAMWRLAGLAVALGGGLRVGAEYGLRLPNGETASGSAAMVEAAARLLRASGVDPEPAATLERALTA